MKISPIAFKKSIPLVQCNIKEPEQAGFVPATLYEYDCQDIEDIKEIRKAEGKWGFKYAIEQNMKRKFKSNSNKEMQPFPFHFYSLKRDDNNEIVGLCQSSYYKRDMQIMYIERNRLSNYKYVGQSMLAAIGLNVLDKGGKQLSIVHPIAEAESFYVDKCGFYNCQNGYLRMKSKDIPEFVHTTEEKIGTQMKQIIS